MRRVRGLTVIILTADAERFAAALALASSNAALGGATRLYYHERAVALLVDESPAMESARELGVTLIACQTGLALAGLTPAALVAGVETGGLVSLLAELGDDRLVTI